MTRLTGQQVHTAFLDTFGYLMPDWHLMPERSKRCYEAIATTLNKVLEQDEIIVTAIRCDVCHEMLPVAHAENHACWVNDSQLDTTLGEYCRSLQTQSEEMLKALVEDYGLETKGENKPSYIDALVKDFRRQLAGR